MRSSVIALLRAALRAAQLCSKMTMDQMESMLNVHPLARPKRSENVRLSPGFASNSVRCT